MNINLVPCSVEEIIQAALKYKYTSESKDRLREITENMYECFAVENDGVKQGYVFSLNFNGIYTLDGYNESSNGLGAIIAGRMMCERLFKVTDEIWTAHLAIEKRVTLLTLKIGFKVYTVHNDYIVLVNRRPQDGN